MGLGSAPVFTAPPIIKQQQKQLQSAPRAASRLHFPVSFLLNKQMQCFAVLKKSNTLRVSCSQVKVEESISDEACELVNGTELTIEDEEADGIRASLFQAVKNNNETGILLLSDILGFEDSATRDFAYRVACNGYNVLVPDLYNGDPWTKDSPNALLEQWISKNGSESIAKTIFASAKWMINEFAALGISKRLGIIGENDALCPVSVLEDITKSNQELTKMVVFRGRDHGFVHRPQTPEEDADAEEAFMIMRNWLHDGLLVKS
ncbi:hypothetical protein DH2020_035130 [Rehmannia glutinosa]|uniref:Carboxymethylenebutenolidase homolog n=1 Tax=Rehmannia glutinosa TaxID=99300 RepID=A0ABR0V9Z7_REHGL